MTQEWLPLFPDNTYVDGSGHLRLGGCDSVELAREFGTPLYVFDEATLRGACRSFKGELERRYPGGLVIYACKAFINRALARLFAEEGLGLDVVSGGELAIARSVSFPLERVYFHGNNKTPQELSEALDCGIGRVVVDNFYELRLLQDLAAKRDRRQDILLRLSPGIDPHTHAHTTTGILDSKFGFVMADGQAEEAVKKALASPNLQLVGLHLHLGSPIYEVEPYCQAIEVALPFAAEMRKKHGLGLQEFSPGGGFAIQYVRQRPAPSAAAYVEAIVSSLQAQLSALALPPPRLVLEPGRAIVGRSGVALYRAGASKNIPGVRRYVSLDGGMADNIRPALYGAQYEAVVANKAALPATEKVTLAGKFCESGDVLINAIMLPPLEPGDLIAVPASGAYCLAMASNYNASLKPAIVLVKEGRACLIRKRETQEDLTRHDLP